MKLFINIKNCFFNMESIDKKVITLGKKINEIEACYTSNNIPFFSELVKLQIKDKIKKDRIDIINLLMNYDEAYHELLNDKLDIWNTFYECITKLGFTIYE